MSGVAAIIGASLPIAFIGTPAYFFAIGSGVRLPLPGRSRNKLVKAIVPLLESGQEWQVDEYRASHPVGISIWIANAVYGLDLDIDSRRVSLSWFDKARIWRAYKRLGANRHDATALLIANRIIARYDDKVVPFPTEKRA